MDKLLSPEQAADALGVRRSTLFTMLSSGEIASIKLGKLRRIPASVVEEYIRRRLAEIQRSA